MNTLITSAPTALGYFNAGHHLSIFEVAAYLRDHNIKVTACDASTSATWRDIPTLLVSNHYNVIAILNDFDLIDGFGRLVQYIREFSPMSRIITFGRLSSRIADFYKQYDIDGIVVNGDYEAGIMEYLSYINDGTYPAGVAVREQYGVWIQPMRPGFLVPVEQWGLPDVTEIPYDSYHLLYSTDQRKFCGVPQRRELVVPVARGCPVGCDFCEVWQREGLKERRLPVERTITYIDEAFSCKPFDYVSFYAPTFTLKKTWVRTLCEELLRRAVQCKWKCTTTQFHLDHNLVLLMGKAGCIRISVGVETFEKNGLDHLPSHKKTARQHFDLLVKWCNEAGIELNCFIVVGLPGTTVEGTKETINYLRQNYVRIRPSIYSDYGLLNVSMSEQNATTLLGRHFLPIDADFSLKERAELYQLSFGIDPNPTHVMDNIPMR